MKEDNLKHTLVGPLYINKVKSLNLNALNFTCILLQGSSKYSCKRFTYITLTEDRQEFQTKKKQHLSH